MKYFLIFILLFFLIINEISASEKDKNSFTQQFLDSAEMSTKLVINSQNILYPTLHNWTDKELQKEFKNETTSLIYKCHINCFSHAKAISPIFSTLKEKKCEASNYNIRIYMQKKKKKIWVAYISDDGKQILHKDKCYHSQSNLTDLLLTRERFLMLSMRHVLFSIKRT